MGQDESYHTVKSGENEWTHETRWTTWKKFKMCCCVIILAVIALIVGLIIIGVKAEQCSVAQAPSRVSIPSNTDGWIAMSNTSVWVSKIQPNIFITPYMPAAIQGNDSPTILSWSNGSPIAASSSQSYLYSATTQNVTIDIQATSNAQLPLTVYIRVLFYCNDCNIIAPGCVQHVTTSWIYSSAKVELTVNPVRIVIAPIQGGIKLQGVIG